MSNSATTTRTNYVVCNVPTMIKMDSSDYLFCGWAYTTNSASGAATSITGRAYTGGSAIIVPQGGTNTFRLGIKRVDGSALTTDVTNPTSDFYKIKQAIKFYQITDKTMTMADTPADAKTVGDDFVHNAKITVNGSNVSTYVGSDEIASNYPNTYFVILTAAVTGGFTNAAFENTHTLLTIGNNTQLAFRVSSVAEQSMACRTLNGNTWMTWQYFYNSVAVNSIVNAVSLPPISAGDLATKYSRHLRSVAENCIALVNANSFDDTPNGVAGIFISINYYSAYYIHLFIDNTAWKLYYGLSGQRWNPINGAYDLFPTGDDTNRAQEIAARATAGKTVKLAPGEYYCDTMVIGGHLEGAGIHQTKLIFKDFDSSGHNYALRLSANGVLSNLTVEKYQANGDITPIANYSSGQNGVRIEGTGSDDSQRIATTIENVMIRNFEGCGLFVRNTGYNPASGSCFHNVRVQNCSVGIYLGEYAEFNKCTDCFTNFCYTGAVVMGGNNVLDNCNLSDCEVCLAMPDTDGYGSSENDAHGIIQACTMVHSGYFTTMNEGYAVKIGAQSSTEIIANCTIANGKIEVTNRGNGLTFNGCDFKKKVPILADGCTIFIMSSVIYGNESPATVANGGKILRRNCLTPNGTDLADVT